MTWWSRLWRYLGQPLVIITVVLWAAVFLLGLNPPPPSRQETGRGETFFQSAPPVTLQDPSGLPKVMSSSPSVQNPVLTTSLALPKQRPKILEHVVQPGESLWGIAQRYQTDVETLAAVNNLAHPSLIRSGQRLKVLTVKGVLHRVQPGETIWGISRLYGVPMEEIITANDLPAGGVIYVNQTLIIPGAKVVRPVAAPVRRTATDRHGRVSLFWPVQGRITSWFGERWGRFHEGLDIAAPFGRLVRAAAGGKVVYAGWAPGYGWLVIVDHGNGLTTRYGHNATLLVRSGQVVQRGTPLATVGSSGRSTGSHLHFEVRVNGQPQNPLAWLRD